MKKKISKIAFGGIFVFASFFSMTFHLESSNSLTKLAIKNAEALAGEVLCADMCKRLDGDVCMLCTNPGAVKLINYNEHGRTRPVVW
ncbi:MAG: hypothetical protein JW801_07360 [Bacteroidales bacterium]|nr:hypothetical protein [Bacteroidales bacterium]